MMMTATAGRAMSDPPMSAMDLRLHRVNQAVALDQAVSKMAGRYTDTCVRRVMADQGEDLRRLERASERQYKAFLRLLYALMRLAQSTDADLQRSVTRS